MAVPIGEFVQYDAPVSVIVIFSQYDTPVSVTVKFSQYEKPPFGTDGNMYGASCGVYHW